MEEVSQEEKDGEGDEDVPTAGGTQLPREGGGETRHCVGFGEW